jgi:hypothetical protein
VHQMLDIVLIQLAVPVNVEFLELFPEEFLVFGYRSIKETGNELCIVNLSTVIEVHCDEYLLDVMGIEICIDLLS